MSFLLRDFYAIENSEVKGGLLGVCGLSISWEDFGEIKSLAIVKQCQKRGLGSRLPHKIWADCVKCLKFPGCDEITMVLKL